MLDLGLSIQTITFAVNYVGAPFNTPLQQVRDEVQPGARRVRARVKRIECSQGASSGAAGCSLGAG